MRRRNLAVLFAILLTAAAQATTLAATDNEKDTDMRLVDAKVVEVNDRHISVVARTGVEHVIATDAADTHVMHKGDRVAVNTLHIGDIVTVELDAQNPEKFARRIVIGEQAGVTLASNTH